MLYKVLYFIFTRKEYIFKKLCFSQHRAKNNTKIDQHLNSCFNFNFNFRTAYSFKIIEIIDISIGTETFFYIYNFYLIFKFVLIGVVCMIY